MAKDDKTIVWQNAGKKANRLAKQLKDVDTSSLTIAQLRPVVADLIAGYIALNRAFRIFTDIDDDDDLVDLGV